MAAGGAPSEVRGTFPEGDDGIGDGSELGIPEARWPADGLDRR